MLSTVHYSYLTLHCKETPARGNSSKIYEPLWVGNSRASVKREVSLIDIELLRSIG